MLGEICVREGGRGCCSYVCKVLCGAGPSRGRAGLSLWWAGQAPQAGEDSGAKAMITAPCGEPLCFSCSLWDTWIPCIRSPCTEGTHRHPDALGSALQASTGWSPGGLGTTAHAGAPVTWYVTRVLPVI